MSRHRLTGQFQGTGQTETRLHEVNNAPESNLRIADEKITGAFQLASGKTSRYLTQLEAAEAQRRALAEHLDTNLSSAILQATSPLRRVKEHISSLGVFSRRAMRTIWRALTLPLPKQQQAGEGQHDQSVIGAVSVSVDPRTIAIPSHSEPVVSVIIPTFGQV